MTLLDIFKKKDKKAPKSKKEIKAAKAPNKIKQEKKPSALNPKEESKIENLRPKKIIGAGFGILRSPHVTEKATDKIEENKYTFKIQANANKAEVKKAVQSAFGVEVIGVNVINIRGKKRRVGKHMGKKQGYKKAIVQIKEGQKIEILPR